jgi:hypothetical protein
MTKRLGILLTLLVAAASLGALADTASARADDPTYEYSNTPSPVWLTLPHRIVELQPWTACWTGPPADDGTSSGMCLDGIPPAFKHLQRAGVRPHVRFWFGMPGWQFQARLSSRRDECTAHPKVVELHQQRFVVRPHARACTYSVELFGRGPEGDVSVSFRWHPGEAV